MVNLTIEEIKKLLSAYGYDHPEICLLQQNNRVTDYLVNETEILRISDNVLNEVEKLSLIKHLKFVPKVSVYKSMEHNKMKFYLAILSFIPGKEFYACIRELNQVQKRSIAKDILSFLTEMHAIRAGHYDVGFYIPTIPKFTGSWLEGHKHYIQWLLNQIEEIELDANLHSKVRQAFKYIDEHIESLEFQSGPVYLHNDLHPKNIIIQDYNFSGVIDYECAQYGERDFDLVHLVHWSLLPPDARSHFNEMVQFIIDAFQKQSYVPELDKRLTIYQLQHEINQIIWNPNQNLQERKTRIDKWLEGVIYHNFFKDH